MVVGSVATLVASDPPPLSRTTLVRAGAAAAATATVRVMLVAVPDAIAVVRVHTTTSGATAVREQVHDVPVPLT